MRKRSVTCWLQLGDEKVEVEASAEVRLGHGGPDPSEIDEFSARRADNDADITDLLSEEQTQELYDALFERAFDDLLDPD